MFLKKPSGMTSWNIPGASISTSNHRNFSVCTMLLCHHHHSSVSVILLKTGTWAVGLKP